MLWNHYNTWGCKYWKIEKKKWQILSKIQFKNLLALANWGNNYLTKDYDSCNEQCCKMPYVKPHLKKMQ